MSSFRFLQNYSLNNLGSIWYCLIATCFQIFIITRGIYRFTAYVALPWSSGQAPTNSINAYMLFIGTSIIILPFFIFVAFMKIGNYSNDGRKMGIFNIGRFSKRLISGIDEIESGDSSESLKSSENHWLTAVWKHSLPTAPLLHLLISICFLFPRLITEAQLIRHGFLSKANIWKTDLDGFIGEMNGRQFNFFGLLRVINSTEHGSLFSESASLGQYFIRNSKPLSEVFFNLNESGHLSLEFINFIGALFVLTVRYPSVFWRANKCFSLLFSAHLLLNLLQSVIAYAAFQVAFKIFVCDPTHLLIRFRDSSSLNLVQLTIIFFLYLLVLHLSSLAMYVYGIQKYREYRYARTKYMQSKYESKSWHIYLSYILAMFFFLLLSVLVGPLFFEFVIIYCGSLSIGALLVIFSTIIYFTCWIVLWVCLAIKTNWSFHYDDFENDHYLLNKVSMLEHSPLVIINGGKVYRVSEDIAKQAIVNFVQTREPTAQVAEENCSNLYIDRSHRSRASLKSCRSEGPYGRSKHTNRRYSMRSVHKPRKVYRNYQDGSDSEGEYTTFRKLRETSPFKPESTTTIPKELSPNEHFAVNFLPADDEPTYGFTYMFNPLMTSEGEPCSPTLGNDKSSDTSSGIHSATSNSSEGFTSNDKVKSNSLESLMHTLQKLEAAAADKPNLRSLSSLQRSINILNSPMDTIVSHEKPKASHVRLTSFENSIYGSRMNTGESKLIEFTQNPDYSKYYIPA